MTRPAIQRLAWHAALLGAACATSLVAVGANAQVLRGRLVTGDSSRGIGGVIVMLQDTMGTDVARTLSTADGSFFVRARAPGTYRIRALRIGFKPSDFGPYRLTDTDQLRLVLPMADTPISLAGITVSAQNECRSRDEGGPGTLALWEEARKALVATVLTRTDLKPVVTIADYERIADVGVARLKSQRVQHQRGPSTRPYSSPLTPEEYAVRGYVESDNTGVTFRAPDADVLLSESFAAAHCFRAVSSPREPGRIGLAFRPTRNERSRIDVAGTLWLDRRSGELRTLDIQYAELPDAVTDAGAGARIEFVRLPTGAWVIPRWDITAPRVVRGQRRTSAPTGDLTGNRIMTQSGARDSVADIWHLGGALLRVAVAGSDVWRGPHARLTGRVVSDTSNSPVRGVTIALLGTDYAVATNSRGEFEIDDVLTGHYELEVRSPMLAALGLDVPEVIPVDLGDSTVALNAIRALTLRDAVARACKVSDTLVAIQGVVHDTAGTPIAGASIVARWLSRVTFHAGGAIFVRTENSTATSGPDGSYRLCGIMSEREVRVVATKEFRRSDVLKTMPPATPAVTTVDITIARASGTMSEEMRAFLEDSIHQESAKPLAGDAGLSTVASVVNGGAELPRGPQRPVVELSVTNADGIPLADVSLVITSGDRIVRTVVTGPTGKVFLADISPGTVGVRARRIGFVEGQVAALVEAGRNTVPIILATTTPPTLDTMRVIGNRLARGRLDEFETRRINHTASASFNRDEIAARNPTEIWQMLTGVSSLKVADSDEGVVAVSTRTADMLGKPCYMAVMVDGIQMNKLGTHLYVDLRQLPRPEEIHGIEVFSGASNIPLQYGGMGAGKTCGLIAIWTR